MTDGDEVTAAIGSAALLRVAALPVSTWLAGGSPALFDRLRALDERTAEYRTRAGAVAEEIGARLVPHPDLDGAGRARALRVRRWLHNGSTTPPAAAVAVADLAERMLPGDGLAASLRGVIAAGGSLHTLRRELEAAILAEEERLLAVPWRLLHESPAGLRAARAGDLALYDDIARRVTAGEPWTGKRMRQRSDYLWRMINRGATRATPRGWLAHVALLPVVGDDGWNGSCVLRVRDGAATEEAENLEIRRTVHGTGQALWSDPSVQVAVTPLSRLDPEHLVIWTLDDESRRHLVEVRLRRSPVLDAILAELADGAKPVSGLLDVLTERGLAGRRALTGLLAHLAGEKALQVSVSPRRRLTGWRPVRATAPHVTPLTATGGDTEGLVNGHANGHAGRHVNGWIDGYVDVYRQAASGIARPYAHRLGRLLELALRVVALTEENGPYVGPPLPDVIGAAPRRLLDVVADCIRDEVQIQRGRPHHHEWPPADRADSGYAGLVRSLSERMEGAESVDVDEETLDAFGAPRPAIDWPLDCLLRTLRGTAGELAVLDQIIPAGMYDARFASALTDLHGEPPQVRTYREFLTRLGDGTGVRFVEILVPPLSSQAANAVRRPEYTELWTGDPDRAGYFRDGRGSYLPLSHITVRTEAGHVVAEAHGEPIWPILHTARVTMEPWQTIVDLLHFASPQPSRNSWRSLAYSLAAWPERDFVPRITVGGGLVLTPAQWRLERSELWHPADRLAGKMAVLERLRRTRRMPRLVSVTGHVHAEPLSVDLASLHGLRALERLLQRGATVLLVRELLAEPGQLPVHDENAAGGCPSVAELLLRLPIDTPARVLARRSVLRAHKPRGPIAVSTADRSGVRGESTPSIRRRT